MGKYQLDDKGRAQNQKFHEKHSNVKSDKQARILEMRAKFLAGKKGQANEESKA
ncbi:hypothetical protein OZX60_06525 [Streptococcaceae bacterium ESL0687]|nr:hypothetical protein OZX60_06525 [Streptococcaceae bacterium ESL0687]